MEYKTLILREEVDAASELLSSIPKEHHNGLARFLESRGLLTEALQVATEPDYKFELAIQLGELHVAKKIAEESVSETKYKQLGELAMNAGELDLAEDCLSRAS